jgi:hypothetical protein
MPRWIRSQKAFALFRYAAWVVVCVGLFIAFMLTPWFPQITARPSGDLLLRILGSAVGVLGAPASLVLWFGMVAFCAREDDSPTGTKIFWFVLFFVAAFFGSAVYFFSVYRKQVHADYVPIGAG